MGADRSEFFRNLGTDLEEYQEMAFTSEEATKISNYLRKASTGSAAVLPMICFGPTCPFASSCQPADTIIDTTKGKVLLQDLDPDKHRLKAFQRKHSLIRGRVGYTFTKQESFYNGNMIRVSTLSGKSHLCTPSHISLVKWSTAAENKYCVYLMKRGKHWRIGRTTLIKRYIRQDRSGFDIGPVKRAQKEEADSVWILDTYDTLANANLGEEYYSVRYSIPKTLFLEDKSGKASQEQLDDHHNKISKFARIEELFLFKGLHICAPFWSRNWDNNISARLGTHQWLQIRSCNLLSDLMMISVQDEKNNHLEPITITREHYSGLIFSLDVSELHTYVANDIVTHNCPLQQIGKAPIGKACLIETQLQNEWTRRYIEQYDVDPDNITEVSFCTELAEIEILLRRLNLSLAKPENSELVTDQTVGIGRDGTPVVQKQLSPFMETKDRLQNRRSKIIKLMVGDRQEKYKKEAALKQKTETDPSSKMALMRKQLENLQRNMNTIEKSPVNLLSPAVLTPEDIFSSNEE